VGMSKNGFEDISYEEIVFSDDEQLDGPKISRTQYHTKSSYEDYILLFMDKEQLKKMYIDRFSRAIEDGNSSRLRILLSKTKEEEFFRILLFTNLNQDETCYLIQKYAKYPFGEFISEEKDLNWALGYIEKEAQYDQDIKTQLKQLIIDFRDDKLPDEVNCSPIRKDYGYVSNLLKPVSASSLGNYR
jgi:hypothetical protein